MKDESRAIETLCRTFPRRELYRYVFSRTWPVAPPARTAGRVTLARFAVEHHHAKTTVDDECMTCCEPAIVHKCWRCSYRACMRCDTLMKDQTCPQCRCETTYAAVHECIERAQYNSALER